jgi:hypothetical protein
MARKNPVEHLYRHQTPTPALIGEVRALGASVLPTLQAMASTSDAENSRAWTGAMAAVAVLDRWTVPGVVPALVAIFKGVPGEGALIRRVVRALSPHAAEVAEGLLDELEGERRLPMLTLAATARLRHPSVTSALLATLEERETLGVTLAYLAGDPGLRSALEARFDARLATAGSPDAKDLDALVTAIHACGTPDLARADRLIHWLRWRVGFLQAEVRAAEEEVAALKPL